MILIISRLLENKYLFIGLMGIKIFGIIFATLIFSRFTPLVDSNLYLQGYYENDSFIRTKIIHFMAIFFNKLGGPYFAHFIFSIISTIGLIYYYLSGGRRWQLIFILLFPSSLVWTSIVGKEAVFFGATGLIIVLWSKYIVHDLNFTEILLVVFSLFFCFVLRPHYAISFIWLFFSVAMLKKQHSYMIPIMLAVLTVGFLVGYFSIWNELLLRGFGGIDPLARASRFAQFGINLHTAEGFDRYKELAILGVVYGIVGPLPSEVMSRIEFLPFFIEGILILIFPLLICYGAQYSTDSVKKKFFIFFGWSLLPAILILTTIHAPFGLLNPGSATRWRTNFEQIFYLAPLMLLLRLTDDGKKNSSLPS